MKGQGCDVRECTDDVAPLRLLLVSTAKTGNTWTESLLAAIYNLPVVQVPGFWDGERHRFDSIKMEALGPRWVAHQHFDPQPELIEWTRAHGAHLITTVRHPADVLVSLFHYTLNYSGELPIAPKLVEYLGSVHSAAVEKPKIRDVETEIATFLRERFFKELDTSLAWLRSKETLAVRYEQLWLDPVATLIALTSQIRATSIDSIERAVAQCEISLVRRLAGSNSKFIVRAASVHGAWSFLQGPSSFCAPFPPIRTNFHSWAIRLIPLILSIMRPRWCAVNATHSG